MDSPLSISCLWKTPLFTLNQDSWLKHAPNYLSPLTLVEWWYGSYRHHHFFGHPIICLFSWMMNAMIVSFAFVNELNFTCFSPSLHNWKEFCFWIRMYTSLLVCTQTSMCHYTRNPFQISIQSYIRITSCHYYYYFFVWLGLRICCILVLVGGVLLFPSPGFELKMYCFMCTQICKAAHTFGLMLLCL